MALLQSKPPSSFRKHVLALLGESYGDKTLVLCPTVFVRLLGSDHKAAILLSQILYWSDKTKDPDGWFYKSYADWQLETGLSEAQVRRIVNGDVRVKGAQVTLRDLGVETLLKKVKHTGAPTLHYRINQAQFLSALHTFLGQGDSSQCAESNPSNAEDEASPMSDMNPDQPQASSDPETPTQISSDETSSDSSNDDFQIFYAFEDRFGKLKEKLQGPFRSELARLGTERVGEVLGRCATRGRSWNYVLKALANETAAAKQVETDAGTRWCGLDAPNDAEGRESPPEPETAPVPVSERVETPWRGWRDKPDGTVQDAWNAALQQLELQFGSEFNVWGRGLTLVDYETNTFTVMARTAYARDLLQHRLNRSVVRILGDVYGETVAVRYLLREEWLEQTSPAVLEAYIA